jgi:hypothetical protein
LTPPRPPHYNEEYSPGRFASFLACPGVSESVDPVVPKRLGLSRTAYLRRALDRERIDTGATVTLGGLERFAELSADLEDPGVMSEAWS